MEGYDRKVKEKITKIINKITTKVKRHKDIRNKRRLKKCNRFKSKK